MTDRDNNTDSLDLITDEIRDSRLDDAEVERITSRSWGTIAMALDGTLSSCGDFQASMALLVTGELSPARALLVEDHTRDCVACRRALLEARGEVAVTAPPTHSGGTRVPRWIALAAAAIIAAGLGLVSFITIGNLLVDRQLTANVATFGEDAQLVQRTSTTALSDGAALRSRQLIRAPKEHGAEVILSDGSVVEMAPRSELDLTGSRRGTTIRLNRGNIIVRAAEQRGGRLFVATEDCRVAVKGTVFAVDHGFKGSRVSVIEGEVEVRRAGRTDVLAPGEQITTNERLRTVPIEHQIAWSPNSERHVALLRELTSLRRELVEVIEPRVPRTASRLLAAVPDDTVIYVAVPNLADGLSEAREILADRLTSSPLLARWWNDNVAANGIDREVDEIIDRLQSVGGTLGNEVVIAVPASAIEGAGAGPIVLATLEDPRLFRSAIDDVIAHANAAASTAVIDLVQDPETAASSTAELLLWATDDMVLAATESAQLVAAARRLGSTDPGSFVQSDLHRRLAEAYEQGVSWLVGVDIAAVMGRATVVGTDGEGVFLDRVGITDASAGVIGYSRDGDERSVTGGLYFSGDRRGMAAWLAGPAPMGSLDFVSPQSSLAAAAVTKDAAIIFDELLAAIMELDPEAGIELDEFERTVGLDLRADFAATLGGEGAFALDGPLLPSPSWKLILEVYDPETLHDAVRRLLAAVNRELEVHDRPQIELTETEVGGRIYHVMRHPGSGFEAAYAAVDGFLVVAPRAAIIDEAIRFRESGVTLPRSRTFRELLPDDDQTGCSALVWRDLADLLDALPTQILEELPAHAGVLLDEGAEPGLWCAYGEGDRILFRGSGGGLLSSVPAVGLLGALAEQPGTESVQDPLSSTG